MPHGRASKLPDCDGAEVDAKLTALQTVSPGWTRQRQPSRPQRRRWPAHNEAEDYAALDGRQATLSVRNPTLRPTTSWRRELSAARATAEWGTEPRPRSSARWRRRPRSRRHRPLADSAVVEILGEEATPLVAELEADAAALVVRIMGPAAALRRRCDIRRVPPPPRSYVLRSTRSRDRARGVAQQLRTRDDEGRRRKRRLPLARCRNGFGPAVWMRSPRPSSKRSRPARNRVSES